MKIKIKKEKIDCFVRKVQGFTLIEALLVLFIFSLIAVTFYSLFSVGTKHILESKFRLGATAVANERMESVTSSPSEGRLPPLSKVLGAAHLVRFLMHVKTYLDVQSMGPERKKIFDELSAL